MWGKGSIASEARLVLAALTVGIHAVAQRPIDTRAQEVSESKNPFTDEFAGFAKHTLDEWHVAGVAISVIDGDNIFAEGYGFATLPDVPATPETLWYAGSTTKAHTAAALAQLIDSGDYPALSRGWRASISTIIRDDFVLQDSWATNHITLEDAVSHRTGLGEHDESLVYKANDTHDSVRDNVRNLRNLPLYLEPRVGFQYCNFMYTVLTHVIETVTGKWLGEVLKHQIWSPLGMHSTYFDLKAAQDAPEHLSTGYYWDKEGKKLEAMPFLATEPVNGAGAIISNVLDYSKWVKCLLRQSEPLSKAVHRDIRKPRVVENPEPALGGDVSLYSLGWFRTVLYGHVAYYHSGSVGSHGALVYWFPDLDYGAVIFANNASPVRQVLMWRLIEDKLQVPEAERYDIGEMMKEAEEAWESALSNATNILFPNRPDPPLPPSLKLSEFVGTYHHQGYGSFELREEPHPSILGQTILVGDREGFLWNRQLRLHHASGDFWTVYRIFSGSLEGKTFSEGQFVVGANDKATGLAITIFDQAEEPYSGTIFYDKIG